MFNRRMPGVCPLPLPMKYTLYAMPAARPPRRPAGRRNGLRHYSGLPVEYLNSWNAQRAAKNTNTAHTGIRTRCQRHATSNTRAIATTRNAPGLYENAALNWPCTSAVTPRVMPQNGHGTPVTVRSGQGGPSVDGSQGRTAATANIPAPATRKGLRSLPSEVVRGAGASGIAGVG